MQSGVAGPLDRALEQQAASANRPCRQLGARACRLQGRQRRLEPALRLFEAPVEDVDVGEPRTCTRSRAGVSLLLEQRDRALEAHAGLARSPGADPEPSGQLEQLGLGP